MTAAETVAGRVSHPAPALESQGSSTVAALDHVVEGGDMRWVDAVDRWANHMRAGGLSAATIQLRRYQISHLGEEILRRSPWRVKPHELTAWLAEQDWMPETRKSWNAALRSFYRFGVEQGYTRKNPADKLPQVRVAQGLPRPVPRKVLYEALRRCESDCERLIVTLAANAGLRRAEIAALRWDQITDGIIRVVGKGSKVRLVPLSDVLADVLDSERKQIGRAHV